MAEPEPVGTPCVDGQVLSVDDVQKISAMMAAQRDRLHRAIRVIGAFSLDAGDCRQLLEMVGIDLKTVRELRPG
jgi:hypothetical protein